MKRPMVYTELSHSGRRYYRCLKGNGHGGCKKHIEITKDTYEHLIKHQNAQTIYE